MLVTGGSSGFGRVIAQAYSNAGARVTIAALEDDAVRRAAEEMAAEAPRDENRKVLGVQADLTNQEDVDRLFDQVIERFGRLDVLVNSAGRTDREMKRVQDPFVFLRKMVDFGNCRRNRHINNRGAAVLHLWHSRPRL